MSMFPSHVSRSGLSPRAQDDCEVGMLANPWPSLRRGDSGAFVGQAPAGTGRASVQWVGNARKHCNFLR